MYLIETLGHETHPLYQSLAISNGERQFEFLESIVDAAIKAQHMFLSHGLLKALNFHAIACLHTHAGEYRPCEVRVMEGGQQVMAGVDQFRVQAAMDHFINTTNAAWNSNDPALMAAFVLWQICRIHPFVNGNGRTARAACYFVLCVRAGGLLPGATTLPTLLKNSPDYLPLLRSVDASAVSGVVDLQPLRDLVQRLTEQQLQSASAETHEPVPA